MFRAIMKNCVHHVSSNCCINSINVAQTLHFNARCLIPNLDELKILCVTYEPAVRVVESWRSEEISDAEISIPDYSVIRLDRNRHEGGIAIYNIVQVVRVHAGL